MRNIQYQSFWTSGHKLYQTIIMPWCSGMEKTTRGEARMVCHPINGLVRGETAAQVIRSGLLDAGGVLLQNADHLFPLAQLISLPFLVRSAEEASILTQAMLEEFAELREELSGAVKLLAYLGSDRFAFASVCSPVKTPADLRGKRVLVWDHGQMDEIRAWGGDPIHVSTSDTYSALERGAGQVAYVPFPAVQSEKLYEKARSISLIPSHALPLAMLMSRTVWNGLPPAAREYLSETTGSQMARHIGRSLVAMTRDEMARLRQSACQVYELTPRETDAFRLAAADANRSTWVDMLNRNGVYDAEGWIAKTQALAYGLFRH